MWRNVDDCTTDDTVVIAAYRPVVNISCRLRCARSHLKQRVEWYRKLMLSSSYLKLGPGVLVSIRVFGRRCSDFYSYIIERYLSSIHICSNRYAISTTCQLFRRPRYCSHKAKRYLFLETLPCYCRCLQSVLCGSRSGKPQQTVVINVERASLYGDPYFLCRGTRDPAVVTGPLCLWKFISFPCYPIEEQEVPTLRVRFFSFHSSVLLSHYFLG